MHQEPRDPAYRTRAREVEQRRYQRRTDRRLWRLNVTNVSAIWIAAIITAAGITVAKCSSDQEIAASLRSSNQQIGALRTRLDEMRSQTAATREQTFYAEDRRCHHWMPDLSLLDPIDTVISDP